MLKKGGGVVCLLHIKYTYTWQDAPFFRAKHPTLPLWSGAVFSSEEYLAFERHVIAYTSSAEQAKATRTRVQDNQAFIMDDLYRCMFQIRDQVLQVGMYARKMYTNRHVTEYTHVTQSILSMSMYVSLPLVLCSFRLVVSFPFGNPLHDSYRSSV